MNKLTAVLGLVALLGNVVTAGQHDWENAGYSDKYRKAACNACCV